MLCSKCKTNERGFRNGWCRSCNAEADRARYRLSPIVSRECLRCCKTFVDKARKTAICSECRNAARRHAYANNISGARDKAIAGNIPEIRHVQKLRREYGLAPEDFESMLDSQSYLCAICLGGLGRPVRGKGQPDTSWAIDHNHETGEVRGVLCNRCNKALGGFRDDADLLLRAADYISNRIVTRKAG